ncbi:putative S-layer protein [Candidatus Woesearchaeota archaeon]|nr:putative S-layer protein [Candidatus Woesearchaeota archaeon]
MKKILSLLFVILFTLSLILSSVFAAGDLSVIDVTNPPSGNPGDTVTGNFKIKNSNLVNPLSGIVFLSADLTHTVDLNTKIPASAITFNPASLATLSANTTSSAIAANVLVPQFIKPGSYTGTLQAKDTPAGANSASFAFTVTVSNMPKLSVTSFTTTSPLTIKEEQGETATGTFVLKNDGNLDLTNLAVTNTVTLKDNDNDEITLTFVGLPTTLTPGNSATITANAKINNEVDFDTYSGIVTVKDTVKNVEASFKLEIKVEPRMCSDGVRSNGVQGGDNLRVDIRDPSSSDRFAPGDDMTIKVNIKNNGDKDMDVIVSAFLFDLDQNEVVEEIESESLEVQDGKSEDYKLSIKVPVNIDVNNKFALFVKAFEEDEEDRNCGEQRRDVDLRRESHSIQLTRVTFTPSSLSCSLSFDATIELQNIGTSQEDDVVARLLDDTLGIDKISNTLTLEKFDKKGDSATVRFRDITIPKDAEAGDNQIETILTFNKGGKTVSKFTPLTIKKCESTETTTITAENKLVDVEVLVSTFNAEAGKGFSIPVTITNKDTKQNTYLVEVDNTNEFADDVFDKTLTLNPGQGETVYFNVITKEGISEGKYTATLVIKTASGILDTRSVTVNVAAGESTFSGLSNLSGSLGSRVFWVVADVILVVAALFFIKMIFGNRKAKKEE